MSLYLKQHLAALDATIYTRRGLDIIYYSGKNPNFYELTNKIGLNIGMVYGDKISLSLIELL